MTENEPQIMDDLVGKVVRLFHVWRAMRTRSKPGGPHDKDYAGRGIMCCDRWSSFENFFRDMYEDYVPGLTLERKDNDKGYSPDNCKWATWTEQNRNKRTSMWVQTPTGRRFLKDVAKETGLGYYTLRSRYRKGERWPKIVRPVTQGGNQASKGCRPNSNRNFV